MTSKHFLPCPIDCGIQDDIPDDIQDDIQDDVPDDIQDTGTDTGTRTRGAERPEVLVLKKTLTVDWELHVLQGSKTD